MLTNTKANEIINLLIGRANLVSIGTVYIGLSTTTPAAEGTNITEPSGNGYKRVLLGSYNQSMTFKMSAANDKTSTNTDMIAFPEATGSWGTITHLVLFTTESANTPFAYGELTTPIQPVVNTVAIIRPEELVISLT